MTVNALANVVLISDPKILSIPINESGEAWVDLRHDNAIILGPSPEIPNNQDYTYLRASVYEKLKRAQARLPEGYHFCLYEGYRSLALQKMIFEKQYANVKSRHPDWTSNQIFNETTKLVSPVINPDSTPNIPPHSTGAAIDVYLLKDNHEPYDMGIHPKDWMIDEDGRLSLTDSSYVTAEAKKNRRIMSEALSSEGFVNYPTEYWHWSYGDRYWAYNLGKPYAIYSNSSVPHASKAMHDE